MKTMPDESNSREGWESYFGERRRAWILRALNRQLAAERRHTDRTLRRLFLALHTQIAVKSEQMTAKLEEIDTSVNLIAAELARGANDPQPKRPRRKR